MKQSKNLWDSYSVYLALLLCSMVLKYSYIEQWRV